METIRKADGKKDKNFINWRQKFKTRMENYSSTPEQYVQTMMTTQGRAGF